LHLVVACRVEARINQDKGRIVFFLNFSRASHTVSHVARLMQTFPYPTLSCWLAEITFRYFSFQNLFHFIDNFLNLVLSLRRLLRMLMTVTHASCQRWRASKVQQAFVRWNRVTQNASWRTGVVLNNLDVRIRYCIRVIPDPLLVWVLQFTRLPAQRRLVYQVAVFPTTIAEWVWRNTPKTSVCQVDCKVSA
jgi:hypothetical protein